MAYEVTKRIKGRDYRYRVEGYRDPLSGKRKTRWQYLGVVTSGKLRPTPRLHKERVTREDIVAATARLLEYRDPSNVTVEVIVRNAGASHSTFYRHFTDRRSVFSAALARISDETVRSLPPLDAPLHSADEARERLLRWCEAYYRSLLQQRALRWALSQGERGKLRLRIERSLLTVDSAAILSAFLKNLNDAGFATIDDPVTLARAIRGVHVALLLATVAHSDDPDFGTPQFAELFPAIERAVFGPRV